MQHEFWQDRPENLMGLILGQAQPTIALFIYLSRSNPAGVKPNRPIDAQVLLPIAAVLASFSELFTVHPYSADAPTFPAFWLEVSPHVLENPPSCHLIGALLSYPLLRVFGDGSELI